MDNNLSANTSAVTDSGAKADSGASANLSADLDSDSNSGASSPSPISIKPAQSDDFYSDDLNAQVIAENKQNSWEPVSPSILGIVDRCSG